MVDLVEGVMGKLEEGILDRLEGGAKLTAVGEVVV